MRNQDAILQEPISNSMTSSKIMVHELIASQARLTPHKIAVRFGDQRLSYGELLSRANQIANRLRARGVYDGCRVAIVVNRSIDMVSGILGCLTAGGAYIPIDPGYPQERIRSIIEDSRTKYILTETSLADSLEFAKGDIVCLDQLSNHEAPPEEVRNSTLLDNPAYIIYTSGSTGKPKGVEVSHRSLSNFVRISQSVLDVNPDDVYFQSASISYAVAVRQLTVPLSRGATLVVANDEQMRDPIMFFEEIKEKQVTLIDVVPSFWRAIVNRLRDLPETELKELMDNRLRRIVSVGEALPFDIPQNWLAVTHHRAKLFNIFGQTETTGIVAAYSIPINIGEEHASVVPIGKSLAETELYILNERLQPVEHGQTGELCISNPCLADGYVGLPELTAEKFIPNPFADGWSDRLYRTGDLARKNSDGDIEFLGRSDTQIKIRGNRLDLGDIESCIRKFDGVQECVVLVAKNHADDTGQLTAYVLSEDTQINFAELKRHCRRSLPEFMVPYEFILFDKLPLLPNGKVDRKAISLLRVDKSPKPMPASNLPSDEVEIRLVRIWTSLLPNKQIGINDDFFDLGGHSLLGVQLFAQIERAFKIRLPLVTLFHATTISQLATVIKTAESGLQHDAIVVPVNRGDSSKPILFGVHGHVGGVLFWRPIVSEMHPDQPFYAIQAQGVDGITPALTRIEEMASLYIRELRKIQPKGPYYLSGFSMGGEICYEMAQQLTRAGESVPLLIMLDTRNPKRLERLQWANHSPKIEFSNIAPAKSHNQPIGVFKKNQWHLHHMASMGLVGKAGYLWMILKAKFKRPVLFTLARIFHAMRLRLPDFILLNYLRTVHSKALYEYTPVPYKGKVVLFRSSQTEDENSENVPWGWSALATNGFEMHRFTASHNIVDDAYAPEVAKKIEECLEKVTSQKARPNVL